MTLQELKDALEKLMPGVLLTYELDRNCELVVRTSLTSHECMPDDTQKLTTESGLEFDAFALADAIAELLPGSEFTDDQWCRSYISTGRTLENATLELFD